MRQLGQRGTLASDWCMQVRGKIRGEELKDIIITPILEHDKS